MNSLLCSLYLEVQDMSLPVLTSHWGGYQGLEATAYQIMLNYRRSRNTATNMTLREIL